jgi:glyoxylase-like metal-dependent hydrolase (beta-lactamase superfamily II)
MEDRQFGRIRFICGENGGRYPFNHSLYIEGDAARVIIDPASNLEKLKRLQKKDGVDLVWLSHWHEDHIRYLYLFEDCPKWISARDFPPLSDIEIFLDWYGLEEPGQRDHWKKEMLGTFNFQPQHKARFIEDDEKIDLGNLQVQVIATPGHTPGHLSFFFPAEEILFLGDYDLTSFGPWYGDVASSIEDTIKSIHRLKAIPAKRWITCHDTGLFEENPGDLWGSYENVIYEREARLLEFLSQPRSLKEIAAAWLIYGKPRKPIEFFEFNELVLVKKHLDYLVRQGRVVCEKDIFWATKNN